MLINLRNALMSGKRTPTARDYVQSGLIWQIDAVENIGLGQHSDTSATWSNLKTGESYHYSITGETPLWHSDSWESVSSTNGRFFSATWPDLATTDGATVEIVSSKTSASRGIIIGAYGITGGNKCNFEWYANSTFRAYYDGSPNLVSQNNTFPIGRRKYLCATRAGNDYAVSNENEILAQTSSASRRFTASDCNIGSDGRIDSMCLYGEICAIRIYNRRITASEIAANYAIDNARFNLP